MQSTTDTKASKLPPSRQGRVACTYWLKKDMRKQIKLAALELECSEQSLIEDAVNNLFDMLNKPRIE